jgi:hypothetical protein
MQPATGLVVTLRGHILRGAAGPSLAHTWFLLSTVPQKQGAYLQDFLLMSQNQIKIIIKELITRLCSARK